MIVSTIDNAVVLVPNKEHKNFTESKDVIPVAKTLVGTFKKINGLRRGKPFEYRVFVTDENKIIYADKVTPQPKEIESNKVATMSIGESKIGSSNALLYAGVGAALGYLLSRRQSKEINTQTFLYVIGGAVVGYYAGKTFKPKPKTLNK